MSILMSSGRTSMDLVFRISFSGPSALIAESRTTSIWSGVLGVEAQNPVFDCSVHR